MCYEKGKANNQKEFLEINNMLAEVKNSMKELNRKLDRTTERLTEI